MRREKSISVAVKAPSRGVITRWPGSVEDEFMTGMPKFSGPGMMNRASSVGSNVRYEDGVTAGAPGYQRIFCLTSLLTDCIAHWRFEEASGNRVDATANGHTLLPASGDPASEPGIINRAVHFVAAAYDNTFRTPGDPGPVGM